MACIVEWSKVERRNRNGWKTPRFEVTKTMEDWGFTDCWAELGRLGPASTCRFDTHIDYVFSNRAMLATWRSVAVLHHNSTASDHRPVIAAFVRKIYCVQEKETVDSVGYQAMEPVNSMESGKKKAGAGRGRRKQPNLT